MLFWIRELVMRNVSSFCLETVTPKDRVTSVVAFSKGGSKIDYFWHNNQHLGPPTSSIEIMMRN